MSYNTVIWHYRIVWVSADMEKDIHAYTIWQEHSSEFYSETNLLLIVERIFQIFKNPNRLWSGQTVWRMNLMQNRGLLHRSLILTTGQNTWPIIVQASVLWITSHFLAYSVHSWHPVKCESDLLAGILAQFGRISAANRMHISASHYQSVQPKHRSMPN